MNNSIPSIIFHIVKDKIYSTKNFNVELDFCRDKKINLNKIFINSLNIGICYEIIQIYSQLIKNLLDKVDFDLGKKNEISAIHFDIIGNTFRSRFLIIVNFYYKYKIKNKLFK